MPWHKNGWFAMIALQPGHKPKRLHKIGRRGDLVRVAESGTTEHGTPFIGYLNRETSKKYFWTAIGEPK